jgi:hypothetical protein
MVAEQTDIHIHSVDGFYIRVSSLSDLDMLLCCCVYLLFQ